MVREHKTYSGRKHMSTYRGLPITHKIRNQLIESVDRIITPTALLPLFHESAHTVTMIRHSMDVVKSAGQIPVLTFDQPLFTLAKEIQWKWPDKYGEE